MMQPRIKAALSGVPELAITTDDPTQIANQNAIAKTVM
jgi:hypothetical protein